MKREKFLQPVTSQIVDGVEVYTTKQVLGLFGLKAPRFRQWLRRDYIKPFRKAKASGSNHYFNKDDLFTIAIFLNLRNLGLNRWIASEWAKTIRTLEITDEIRKKEHFYIVLGGEPYRQEWKNYYEPYLCDGPLPDLENNYSAVVIDLKKILTDIDRVAD